MERRLAECVKEQLHTEKTIKTEVEAAVQTSAHIDIEIDVNSAREEPWLLQYMESESALLVKEEVLEDSRRDGSEQQCVQDPSAPAGTGSLNDDLLRIKDEQTDVVIEPTELKYMDLHNTLNKGSLKSHTSRTSTRAIVDRTGAVANDDTRAQLLHIKEQLEDTDLDIGPTMLQHMDSHYKSKQKVDSNSIKQENAISLGAEEVILKESRMKDGPVVRSRVTYGIIADSQDESTAGVAPINRICKTRADNKAAERSRLYRERHREEINERRRHIRQRQQNLHQIHNVSNVQNTDYIEQITQETSNNQFSSNSRTQRQQRYYERHKEEINKRKRDSRLKQNNSQSIPATAAERNRNYRERNRQEINERRRDSRLRRNVTYR